MPRTQNPLPQLIPQRVRRLKAEVDTRLWTRVVAVAVEGGPVNPQPLGLARGQRQAVQAVRPGEHFGRPGGDWQQRWFKVVVPAAGRGEAGRRFLDWRCQGETTVYHNGVPWAGLDLAHPTCPLPDEAAVLWLDCSTWQTGIWIGRPEREQIGPYGLRFDGCSLRVRDQLAWKVSCDLDVLLQVMQVLLRQDGVRLPTVFGHLPTLESCSPLLRRLLRGLDHAGDAFVSGGVRALSAALDGLMASLPAETWQPAAALCGHAHLDLVWLWPELATRRKGVHGFATQLRLMERYPEITFVQSQPALYRAVQQDAPLLMREVQHRVRQGRWEVMGAFEVEPDTNLPCGEALARSLIYGQRKIRALRGRPSPVCWIPDVFGYSACLPQILRLGGVQYFYTTKMTWSAITKFPYNSFVWRGSDGSEVLAHLCTTGYNGTVDVDNVVTALRDHRQADVHPELLLPTGFGDGGGGLTEQMCERSRRLASLAGVPRTSWTTTEAFFDRLAQRRSQLPVYQGELYLEYHRGTLTTQSEFKRWYRAAETALQVHEAVRVATAAGPLPEADWLRVLFCQFHDALPGSSIGLVYAQLQSELADIVARSLAQAATELGGSRAQPGHLVFNPLPVPRTVVVELPRERSRRLTVNGAPLAVQAGRNGRGLLAAVSVPALAAVRVRAARARRSGVARRGAVERGVRVTPRTLDNGIVQAGFDRNGQLATLRIRGETLELAAPAHFALYHDLPAYFDAWDIDHDSLRHAQPVAAQLRLSVLEKGPVRASLHADATLGERSRIAVEYGLDMGSAHLSVTVRVEWGEAHRLLKFHVPTTYRGRWARFGCPFGSIQRPQLPGTAADEAMWEVAGSRWAAVTHDDGIGLAICTEAKYGFACRDGDLSVSLLRSAKEPDPQADMGTHVMRFAVGRYARATSGTTLATPAAADALFVPTLISERGQPRRRVLEWEDLGTLVPVWVLPGARGSFIIRLHESAGSAGRARLRLSFTPRSVQLVDFIERRTGAVQPTASRTFEIPYRPYQILSVRVRR
jgi:alpha-mannosidase